MEILYEKVLTMRKEDECFSNKYYEVSVTRGEKMTEIRFVGRFSSRDDMKQYIPKDWEYKRTRYEKGNIVFEFVNEDKPIELRYKLTNRKEERK